MENQNRRQTEEIAKQVCDAVGDMLESLKLGQLNQAVRDTAGSVLEEAKSQMEQYRNKVEDAKWRRQKVSSDVEAPKPKELDIRVNLRGRVSGILFTVFGSIGSGVFGILLLVLLVIGMTAGFSVGMWLAGISGVIAGGFGMMLWKGISQNGRIGRLKGYVAELKHYGKTYCEIERLSRSSGRTLGFVKKDLRKMLRLGMLPDARMDEKGQWLILDEETYRQYRLFQESMDIKEQEKKAAEKKKNGKQDTPEKEEKQEGSREAVEGGSPLDTAIRQGEAYMENLDRLRESIPSEPVREKLLRLDRILEKLFETLKKHPDQLDEMEKFMEYYLPTTVKLVSTYQEFAAVEFPGENINGAKEEIEEALDTINGAFEKFLDDLYEDAALDIITDASVIKTMLAKDGMTEDQYGKRF